HRVRYELELSRSKRWCDENVGAREIRSRRAAATALSAVVTCGTSVERLRDHRAPSGNARDLELVARFLDQVLVAARCRWRMKDSVRLVANSFFASVDADQAIDAIE